MIRLTSQGETHQRERVLAMSPGKGRGEVREVLPSQPDKLIRTMAGPEFSSKNRSADPDGIADRTSRNDE